MQYLGNQQVAEGIYQITLLSYILYGLGYVKDRDTRLEDRLEWLQLYSRLDVQLRVHVRCACTVRACLAYVLCV